MISDSQFKLLTEIKNNNGPNIDHWQTPQFQSVKDVFFLLKLMFSVI